MVYDLATFFMSSWPVYFHMFPLGRILTFKNEPLPLYLCLSIIRKTLFCYIASGMSATFISEAEMYCPNPSEQRFNHKCPIFFIFDDYFFYFVLIIVTFILRITGPGTCASETNVYPSTLKHDIPCTTNKRHADGDGLDVDLCPLNWSSKCFLFFCLQ